MGIYCPATTTTFVINSKRVEGGCRCGAAAAAGEGDYTAMRYNDDDCNYFMKGTRGGGRTQFLGLYEQLHPFPVKHHQI